MKKFLGFLSSGFLAVFFLITGPVAVTSCEKEIIRDTIIVTDTLVIKDTITITDSICYDLKDGLVAWYNFNKGTLKDSSGLNNHIVFNNATSATDRFGKADNAYLFNGTSSYMKVENSTSLNPNGKISLMAIVKFNGFYTGLCHGNQIFMKCFQDQNNGVYGLRVGTFQDCSAITDLAKERIYGYYGNNQFNSVGAVDQNTVITTGQWYNVVFTYDGAQTKIYLNGVLKETKSGSAIFTPTTEALFIGRAERPDAPYWLNGVIDEIRIYNKDLCEGEVKQLNRLKD